MSKNILEAINEKVGELEQTRANCTERLQSLVGENGEKFDFTRPIPGVEHSSGEQNMGDIDTRVLGLIGLVTGLNSGVDLTLVPNKLAVGFHSHLAQLAQQYQDLKNYLDGIDGDGGVGNLDQNSFAVQSKNGQINLQLQNFYQQIHNSVESTLMSYYHLANVLKEPAFFDFSAAFREFSRQVSEVQKTQANLSQLVAGQEKAQKQVQSLRKQADVLKEELDRLKTEGEKDRKTITEYTEESTQKVTAIRTTNEQAEQLQAAVQNYQSTFDVFQNELERRETTFKTGKEQQEKLIEELNRIKEDTKELTKNAEGMLTGSTVAGLAGSFGELRDKLGKEVEGARRTFYIAVFLLFLSMLPLLIYVFPWSGSMSATNGEADPIKFFGQIIVRALLLLPAGWFAKFAATRHAVLFRLKENYAYKYSVASSVDGFKKQAEPFKDAIAATTFFELTFNPADRMEGKGHEERHPNPAMEWLMKKLGTTYDGK